MNYWLLNTDEAEPEGKGADDRMKARSVIAAWGSSYSAESLLAKPEEGDVVFYFLNKEGIIAMATFDSTEPVPSNNIFHKEMEGEFSRKVTDLLKLPSSKWIKPAAIKVATNYSLPSRGLALCELHNMEAIRFILSKFH